MQRLHEPGQGVAATCDEVSGGGGRADAVETVD